MAGASVGRGVIVSTARTAGPLSDHGLSSALLDRLNEATKFADEWPINPDRAKSYSAVATEVLDVLRRVLAEDIRPT